MPRWTIIATAALAAPLLAGCGAASPITVHGTLQVTDTSDAPTGCDYTGTGYSDIAQGTQVTVTSPQGTVLGSGSLGNPASAEASLVCTFPFTVTGVQGGDARYGVTVARRGTVWFTPGQIQHAALQLGS